MEPKIRDGSWNLFRGRSPGSRDDKIVLVQFKSRGDLENGGRFTVKKYQSVNPEPPAKWFARSDPAAVTAVEPRLAGGVALTESATAKQREVDDGVIDPQGRTVAPAEAQTVIAAEAGRVVHRFLGLGSSG